MSPIRLIAAVRHRLEVVLMAAGGIAYVVCGLPTMFAKAYYRLWRRRGVLETIQYAPTIVDSAARPVVRYGNETGTDCESVLGYASCAYAALFPGVDDNEGDAFRLAARDEIPDSDGDSRAEEDQAIWSGFHLDDPLIRRRYQEMIPLSRLLVNARACIYCGSSLHMARTDDLRLIGPDHKLIDFFHWKYYTAECVRCGWWCVTYHREQKLFAFDVDDYFHAYAVMRWFDPLALSTPLDLARGFLSRHPHKLARFDPFRFEDLLTDCLKDVYGDSEIVKLGGRQDRGIDIKAVSRNGDTTLIQVKRRADFTKAESVSAVRELHGVMLREGIPRGMVITTANSFSPAAYAEVADAGRRLEGYSMELLPLSDVIDLLGQPKPLTREPWKAHGIRVDSPEPSWDCGDDWIDRTALPNSLGDISLYAFRS